MGQKLDFRAFYSEILKKVGVFSSLEQVLIRVCVAEWLQHLGLILAEPRCVWVQTQVKP
jgi:hypothetical protein